jgi:hypothetical protein
MAMPNTQSVVLLEFNELTPSLMSRFIGSGLLPNFKQFYDESLVFTSVAAEREPNLEPWIQWVTVHTGLPLDASSATRRPSITGAKTFPSWSATPRLTAPQHILGRRSLLTRDRARLACMG